MTLTQELFNLIDEASYELDEVFTLHVMAARLAGNIPARTDDGVDLDTQCRELSAIIMAISARAEKSRKLINKLIEEGVHVGKLREGLWG